MSRPRVESVWSDEVLDQRGLPGCVACRGRVLRAFGVMKCWTSGAARPCGMSRPRVESVWSDEVLDRQGCQAVWHVAAAC